MGKIHQLLLAMILLLVFPANAAVLVEHLGANNPLNEGWEGIGLNISGNIAEPVFDDQGRDSWHFDNFTNSTSQDLQYVRSMTSQEVSEALTKGWALRAIVKVNQASHSIVRFSTGSKLYTINLSSENQGVETDPVVRLEGGPSTTLVGGGGLYHDYLLQDPDGDGLADLHINGNLVFSNFAGQNHAFVQRVSFGDNSGSSANNFNNNYGLVSFVIDPQNTNLNLNAAVPEPSSLLLCLLGCCVLAGCYVEKVIKKRSKSERDSLAYQRVKVGGKE